MIWSAATCRRFKSADMSAHSKCTASVDKIAPHAVTSQPAMKIETIAVHAGHSVDSATGAVAAPIYLSTTFERDIEGTLLARIHVLAQ